MASGHKLASAQWNCRQPARRSAVCFGRAILAAALFLLGVTTISAADAKALPHLAIGFAQIVSTTNVLTPLDDDERAMCPICGRAVGTVPSNVRADSPSGGALAPADAVPIPANGSVQFSCARAAAAPVSTFPASFEARGPPFVD